MGQCFSKFGNVGDLLQPLLVRFIELLMILYVMIIYSAPSQYLSKRFAFLSLSCCPLSKVKVSFQHTPELKLILTISIKVHIFLISVEAEVTDNDGS